MSKAICKITWRARGCRVVITAKHWQDVVRGMKEAAREVIRQAFERFPVPAGLALAVAKHDAERVEQDAQVTAANQGTDCGHGRPFPGMCPHCLGLATPEQDGLVGRWHKLGDAGYAEALATPSELCEDKQQAPEVEDT